MEYQFQKVDFSRFRIFQISKTINSLWAHVGCFVPLIGFCLWAYLLPDEVTPDENREACFHAYKVYMLIAAISLIAPTLFVLYIVGCNRFHTYEAVETFAAAALTVECIVFTGLFIYHSVLKREN